MSHKCLFFSLSIWCDEGWRAGGVVTEREFCVGGSHSIQTIKVWQLQYSKIDTTHLRLNLVHRNTSRVALSQLHSLTTSKPLAPLLDLQYLGCYSTPRPMLKSESLLQPNRPLRCSDPKGQTRCHYPPPRLHRAHCRVTVAACRQGAPCRGNASPLPASVHTTFNNCIDIRVLSIYYIQLELEMRYVLKWENLS